MQVSDALEPFVHVTGLRKKLVGGGLSTGRRSTRSTTASTSSSPPRAGSPTSSTAAPATSATSQIAVLDEADHMADMGFLPEVTAMLDQVPAGGQRLLFSATLDNDIDTLVKRYLVDPVTHSTDEAQATSRR